jgi:hypothetical protein
MPALEVFEILAKALNVNEWMQPVDVLLIRPKQKVDSIGIHGHGWRPRCEGLGSSRLIVRRGADKFLTVDTGCWTCGSNGSLVVSIALSYAIEAQKTTVLTLHDIIVLNAASTSADERSDGRPSEQ